MGKMKEDGLHYFNRCRRCNSIITKLEILSVFETGENACACGSSMFGPTNPLWYEWLKPKMLKMVYYQLRGKLAPAPAPETRPPIPIRGASVAPLSPDEIREPEEGE